MNLEKHSLILAVIEGLHRHGSWTGKTHVQKALSLLRDKSMIPVPFQFVLYRHGPYSFDVEAELEQMRSYGAIEEEPNDEGYGVVLSPSSMAEFAYGSAPLSEAELAAVEDVCAFVGKRNILELERLATASWIRQQEKVTERERLSKRLNAIKPHISIAEASRADAQMEPWLSTAITAK